jgi:broad specificity phosphatase PhoE
VLLALVRHGESTWNAERRMQGQADPPLSDEGRAQALALRLLLDGPAPDAVVASDLARARETAELLGHPDAVLDRRWREADVGRWSGRLVRELIAEDPDAYRGWLEHTHTPPGGEPWGATRERVAAAARALAADGVRTALVVTHGGPVRACCEVFARLPRSHLVPVPTASLTVIDLNDSPRLIAFGAAVGRSETAARGPADAAA